MSQRLVMRPLLFALAAVLCACAPTAQPASISASGVDDLCRNEMDPGQGKSKVCQIRETTIPMPASGELDISAGPNGDIHVEAWDRPDVLVKTRIVAVSNDGAETRRLVDDTEIQTAGGVIRHRSPEARSASIDVSYWIYAPRSVSLTLESSNGDVDLRRIAGAISATTQNGDVSLTEASGAIRARTANGDVEMRLSSPARGTIDIETRSGDIVLRLPRGFASDVDVSTRNGEISARGVEVLDARYEDSRRGESIRGKIGGGGQRLHAETTNGDVTLRLAR